MRPAEVPVALKEAPATTLRPVRTQAETVNHEADEVSAEILAEQAKENELMILHHRRQNTLIESEPEKPTNVTVQVQLRAKPPAKQPAQAKTQPIFRLPAETEIPRQINDGAAELVQDTYDMDDIAGPDKFELPADIEQVRFNEFSSDEIFLPPTEINADGIIENQFGEGELLEPNKPISATEEQIEQDGQLENIFDNETIKTYDQLIEIIFPENAEPIITEKEDPQDINEGSLLTHQEASLENHAANDFAEFLTVNPGAEEPVTMEVIKEHAGEQPLEQTFVQLAELLTRTVDEATLKEKIIEQDHVELMRILSEIEDELPACSIVMETGDQRLRITPEMTDKLIKLLRLLGYERPGEVLVDFVRQYGISNLLQALQLMCQLNSETERKELLTGLTKVKAGDDDSTRLKLVSAIFKVIASVSLDQIPYKHAVKAA